MTFLIFLCLAVACFINMVRCIILLKRYKSGEFVFVKNLSSGTYTTETNSKTKPTKIKWNAFTVEIPDKVQDLAIDMNPTIETTVSTTNRKAKKYKNDPYINLFVIYGPDGRIKDAVIKEDMATVPEMIFSLIMGCLFMIIAILTVTVV